MNTNFEVSNNTMSLVTGTYHVFGSGAAGARLLIDGERVRPVEDGGNNGFVGVMRTTIPIAQLAAAKKVEFYRGFFPGRSVEFSGPGKSFIRWAYEQANGFFSSDPLRTPLAYRPRYAEYFRKKREAAKAARIRGLAEIGKAEIREDKYRVLISADLRRGAVIRRWTGWRRTPS